MPKNHCPICGEGDSRAEPLFLFPESLRELGYFASNKYAHASCVTTDKSRMEKRAKALGVKLADVVAERRV